MARSLINGAISKSTATSALLAIACLGCGQSGPELVSVEGVVTIAGTPVKHATVVFVPKDPSVTFYGETDAEGRYTMRYINGLPGIPAGDYTARLEAPDIDVEDLLPEGVDEDELSNRELKKLEREAYKQFPQEARDVSVDITVSHGVDAYDISA